MQQQVAKATCPHCNDAKCLKTKCPTKKCAEYHFACVLQAHHGTCLNCAVILFSHGKHAQDRINEKGFCQNCFGAIVPFGNARANGKDHDDWPNRRFHKKCWYQLKNQG